MTDDLLADAPTNPWDWSHMLSAGDVRTEPDADHPVEVQGYEVIGDNRPVAPGSLYIGPKGTETRPINAPVYVPRAYIEAMGIRFVGFEHDPYCAIRKTIGKGVRCTCNPRSMLDRLDSGEVVETMFNRYRLVPIPRGPGR